MNIAFIAPINYKKTSGPKNSVTLLANFLEKYGHQVRVFSDTIDAEFYWNDICVHPLKGSNFTDVDYVIFNGVYNLNYIGAMINLYYKKVGFVLSPRSSLMRASMRKSYFKKKLFLLFFGFILNKSKAIHFLTDEEKVASLFNNCDNFVCGNIVGDFPRYFNEEKSKIIRFVGRFDINHKGLDILIDSILMAADKIREKGWQVHLHGPEFEGGKMLLENRVNDYSFNDIVFFNEASFGSSKNGLLDRSSIFIHTSRYEGQPQAVMEAMAFGNAVLVTPGTNMSSIVNASGSGLACSLDKAEIASSIIKLISIPAQDLKEIQLNAFKFAKENFTGESVVQCFVENLTRLKIKFQ